MNDIFSELKRRNVGRFAIAFAFVLALSFIIYEKLITPNKVLILPVEAGQAAIAILPFKDVSAAGDQEYFAQGIAAEIHKALVKIPNLEVAGRSSSFQLWKQNADLGLIRDTLGVNYILEGSFSSKGGQAQITVTLINVSSGDPVWLETFDRKLADIFAIQREITDRIIKVLLDPQDNVNLPEISAGDTMDKKLKMGPKPLSGGTLNYDAYNLYLQAIYIRADRSKETLTRARALLNRAVEIDPNFANAWGAIAKVTILLQVYGFISPDEALTSTKQAAFRALALDQENSEALASLGLLKREVEFDFLGGGELLLRAIQSNPKDVEANHWYATQRRVMGSIKEALESERKAYQLDPFYNVSVEEYVTTLLAVGDLEKAKEVLATITKGQLGRGFELDRLYLLFLSALMEENVSSAEAYLAQFENMTGERAPTMRYLITESDEDKQNAIEFVLGKYQAGKMSDMKVAEFYSSLGDYEKALPFARNVVDDRRAGFKPVLMYGAHPAIDPRFRKLNADLTPLLRHLPEYVEAYERAGIDIYQMLQIERPVAE